jgi:hypothetical protein
MASYAHYSYFTFELGEDYTSQNWKTFLFKLHSWFTMFDYWAKKQQVPQEMMVDFLDIWCTMQREDDPFLYDYFLPYRRIFLNSLPSSTHLKEMANQRAKHFSRRPSQ